MSDFDLPEYLSDRLFEIRVEGDVVTKIISYFPLDSKSQEELKMLFDQEITNDIFNSIFSDHISDEEWEKSKAQIKRRFCDELFEID